MGADGQDLPEKCLVSCDQQAELFTGSGEAFVEGRYGGAFFAVRAQMHGFIIIESLVEDHQDSVEFLADDLAGLKRLRRRTDELISSGQVVGGQPLLLLLVGGVKHVDAAVVRGAGPVLLVEQGAQEGEDRAVDADIAREFQLDRKSVV